MRRSIVWCCLLLVFCIGATVPLAGETESLKMVMILPPATCMGSEFVPLMQAFADGGVEIDVVAEQTGPYTFWEDTVEGRFAALAGLGSGYEFDIELTYEDVSLADYDALVVGPGFAHTFWVGDSLEIGKALVAEAVELGIPLGGVSWGAMFLIGQGVLDGRTAAQAPMYRGVVSPERHAADFLSLFDVVFSDECTWIARGVNGLPTVVTSNYRCVYGFARAMVEVTSAASP